MLKVYRVANYVSVDDGEWYEVGGAVGITMFDDSKPKEIVISQGSFDDWCKLLQETRLDGISYETTFFRKKPCIITHDWSYFDNFIRYTHFNTLSYKTVYKEMPDVSLDYIMKHFSADKCIQYLKERGCPMNF